MLLTRTDAPLAGEELPGGLRPAALVILGDRPREDAARVLGNIERTSGLYLTKTVYAMLVSLAVGPSGSSSRSCPAT